MGEPRDDRLASIRATRSLTDTYHVR